MINRSILLIAVGSILWAVIGPAIVLLGIPTPRTSGDYEWAPFEAFSWLSGRPSIAEISSTYRLGSTISITGLSILAAGVIGIILVAAREMRARVSYQNPNRKKRSLG